MCAKAASLWAPEPSQDGSSVGRRKRQGGHGPVGGEGKLWRWGSSQTFFLKTATELSKNIPKQIKDSVCGSFWNNS